MLRPVIFLLAICCAPWASAQIDTSKITGHPVARQHFAVKYNIGLLGVFFGAEGLATYAPYNWLHVQASYRAYEAGFTGMMKSSGPHRTGWDVYFDVKAHIAFGNTFTGCSVGPYYNYGSGGLSYKERFGPYDERFYDKYDFRRHVIGASVAFPVCVGKKKNVLLELYYGIGYTIKFDLQRRPLEHPDMPDHTAQAKAILEGGFRGGFSIGYVFF